MEKTERNIAVYEVNPPIPVRWFDYCASRDGYELGDAIGYGTTGALAKADLLLQESLRCRLDPSSPIWDQPSQGAKRP